jgi:autotransporter family porin
MNATTNATTWWANGTYPRATGNFTGSTDDLIRWAACKWGMDEQVLRAQVAKESWWDQGALGDWTTNAAVCAPGHPIGADGRPGQCPESVGLMQVRTQYFRDSVDGALASSAYNLDVSLAVWRNCFEGRETWLNDVDRGRQYAAGDMWGCIGRWFAGRWYTPAATTYVSAVQDYLARRIWESPEFLGYTG